MPYPARLLHDDEVVILDLRPHWSYFGRQMLTGAPLLVVVVLVLSMKSGTVKDVLGWLVVLLVVVWAGWLTSRYLGWSRSVLVVTNLRVISRTGVVARRGVEIPLDRINNVNFRQRFLERIVGVGLLDIESVGELGTTVLDFVRYPDGVQAEIHRQMGQRDARATVRDVDPPGEIATRGPTGGGQVASIPEQISALASLRDAGHITSEEYESKKAELLRRM